MSDQTQVHSQHGEHEAKEEKNWVVVFAASLALFLAMYGIALFLGHTLAP